MPQIITLDHVVQAMRENLESHFKESGMHLLTDVNITVVNIKESPDAQKSIMDRSFVVVRKNVADYAITRLSSIDDSLFNENDTEHVSRDRIFFETAVLADGLPYSILIEQDEPLDYHLFGPGLKINVTLPFNIKFPSVLTVGDISDIFSDVVSRYELDNTMRDVLSESGKAQIPQNRMNFTGLRNDNTNLDLYRNDGNKITASVDVEFTDRERDNKENAYSLNHHLRNTGLLASSSKPKPSRRLKQLQMIVPNAQHETQEKGIKYFVAPTNGGYPIIPLKLDRVTRLTAHLNDIAKIESEYIGNFPLVFNNQGQFYGRTNRSGRFEDMHTLQFSSSWLGHNAKLILQEYTDPATIINKVRTFYDALMERFPAGK